MSNELTDSFNSAVVGLIDYYQSGASTYNLLVRGNLPLSATSPYYLDYSGLSSAIAGLEGNPVQSFDLSNYQLLVISLLNNAGDWSYLQSEVGNFNVTLDMPGENDWPSYQYGWTLPSTLLGTGQVNIGESNNVVITANGNLVWWPFEPQLNQLSSGFQFDALVTFANTQLVSPPPPGLSGTVVYVHCDSGVNRTGTFTAAYLLLYGSQLYPPPDPVTLTWAMNTAGTMPQNQVPDPYYYPMLVGFSLLIPQDFSNSSGPGCRMPAPACSLA